MLEILPNSMERKEKKFIDSSIGVLAKLPKSTYFGQREYALR